MQASDFCHPFDATMTTTQRFASGDPATLLLVQAAQNKIQRAMILPFRMLPTPARGTTTLANARIHRHFPASMLGEAGAYNIASNHEIDLGRLLT
jgi:hypothetical protein